MNGHSGLLVKWLLMRDMTRRMGILLNIDNTDVTDCIYKQIGAAASDRDCHDDIPICADSLLRSAGIGIWVCQKKEKCMRQNKKGK